MTTSAKTKNKPSNTKKVASSKKKKTDLNGYDADAIQTLEGLEAEKGLGCT